MLNNLKNKILQKNTQGEEISPFLFVSKNIELLNNSIFNFSLEIIKQLDIPKTNIFILKDDWESIKINWIKDFLSKMNSRSWYSIQIFIIENISRLTLQAANSVLKQFEEPWIWNLVFLTNKSESQVLDTILSRVQVINLWLNEVVFQNDFYLDLLRWYTSWKDNSIISYFFKNKLEKQEYINFLEAIIDLQKKWFINILNNMLDDLLDDINMIANNNVNARWIIDKWILLIK